MIGVSEQITGSRKLRTGSRQRASRDRGDSKQVDDEYVVDYMAFNFIGKVIDTPALW